jgi:hypothetical protein
LTPNGRELGHPATGRRLARREAPGREPLPDGRYPHPPPPAAALHGDPTLVRRAQPVGDRSPPSRASRGSSRRPRAISRGYGLALATIHLDDPAPADDLRAALAAGCLGLKIHEDVQGLAIDDPRFEPVYTILGACRSMPIARSKPPVPPNTSLLFGHNATALLPHRASYRRNIRLRIGQRAYSDRLLAEHEAFVLAHVGPIPWGRDTRDGPGRVAAVLARHPRLRIVVARMGVPDTLAYIALTRRFANLFIDTTMAFASDDLRTDARPADSSTTPKKGHSRHSACARRRCARSCGTTRCGSARRDSRVSRRCGSGDGQARGVERCSDEDLDEERIADDARRHTVRAQIFVVDVPLQRG